ncbi:GNAT family N-acetyltransferase [Aeromicrobium choanae]|uniref:Acetyltransferase (GNAT) family protein n=1 Tax=Aeromicrobium choanae TaxID=1736691 RepID=A0A1T4Z7M3_9ACTN|nr:GNAT family N-acetyltransferase [Aeromicrobium choanae]SKB10050.1 Acetyltransferase (GNAT) family protein [Aeromicrobium choanae]
MMWRVRTTLENRPGILAEIALACGQAEVNIASMQVFPGDPTVTDEFVVSAAPGMTDLQLAEVFEKAGGTRVAVTRTGPDALDDEATRYLRGMHEVLEGGRDVESVLRDLLGTTPPDVLDYNGHDVLDLQRRNGTSLRISRAVPFTPAERSRAQALLSLVSDAGMDVPLLQPAERTPLPLTRRATLADIEGVAALHQRCSAETIYHRYQAPLRMPMTTRLARRLVVPDSGLAIVVQSGLDIVGHGLVEQVEDRWTFHLIVEDAWQGRGIGTMLVKQGAGRARALGAQRLTFVTATANDTLLRTVGRAGFVARVERHDGNVHITVPLAGVSPLQD